MHRVLPAAVTSSDYKPEIDGLRAIAVLAVISHHFWQGLLPGGFLGVDMFFVISGYVITASLSNHSHRSVQDLLLGFYARRVKRLVPALVVCVLTTALLGVVFINPEHPELRSSLNAGAASLFGLSNIFFFREARDYFGASTALNLFTHTWSLGVEEQFYLFLPVLFWVSVGVSQERRRTLLIVILSALTALSFATYLWLSRVSHGAYFMMPLRFWELSIGCLLALLVPATNRNPCTDPGFRYAPWVAFAAVALALLAPDEMRLFTTPLIVASTATLIATLQPKHPIFRLLTLRIVLLIGLMSYSLYLWHWSVLSISRWTWGVNPLTAPFQIATILVLGALSYFFVERPLRRSEWSPKAVATIAIGFLAISLSAGFVLALKSKPFGALYTGAALEMAAKGVTTLLDDKLHSAGKWRALDCILESDKEVGKTISRQHCSINNDATTRRFVVIGNSFSAAQFEMYTILLREGLGSITITSSWGASPVPEIPNFSPWSKANAYYWDTVVPQLIAPLSAGDVIIMINDIQGMTPETMADDSRNRLTLLKAGLQRLSRELQERQVSIVFQASIPFIREANCSPDMAMPQWFHFGRTPNCRVYAKNYSMSRRKPLLDVLDEIESTHWNFHVLDLFPVFCADEICTLFNRDKVPLYRDMFSHPSVEANKLASPAFLAIVKQALAAHESVSRAPYVPARSSK